MLPGEVDTGAWFDPAYRPTMPFAVALAQREFHLTLTRCRTVDLVLLCDLVNRPMLRGLAEGFVDSVNIPHAHALVEFAEAIVLRDEERTARARAALLPALGKNGLVDAAAVVAAFHGFVRIADAIGIPYQTAARGNQCAPGVGFWVNKP